MHLLLVTEEEKTQILKFYNVDKSQIKEDIEAIKVWKSIQPHLPGDLNDNFIEKLLLKNKFSVERTKQKIENYYTIRGLNKSLLEGYENLIPSKQALIYLPLPKITPTLERIVFMKLINTDPKVYDILQTFKLALGVTELSLRHDESVGTRFVVDYKGFTLKHLATWNPVLILKYVNMAEKAYSLRILSIDNINLPSFVNKIFAILKMVLRPKIYERIKVHEDLESLHKAIPKEYLPVDYGGCIESINALLGKWDDEYRKQKSFLVKCLDFVSLEHLRPEEAKDNDLFGTGGTFKKLSLD